MILHGLSVNFIFSIVDFVRDVCMYLGFFILNALKY